MLAKEIPMKWQAALATFFSIVAFAGSPSKQAAGRIWISKVTIISPENLKNVAVGSVLIEDGRIIRVERTNTARIPSGATVVSGKGQFLIPGLIESHVHLASVPGVRPD